MTNMLISQQIHRRFRNRFDLCSLCRKTIPDPLKRAEALTTVKYVCLHLHATTRIVFSKAVAPKQKPIAPLVLALGKGLGSHQK
jgi:hypothetical protein